MKEISVYSWPEEYSADIERLSKLLGRYKFRDAQEIVAQILAKLEKK